MSTTRRGFLGSMGMLLSGLLGARFLAGEKITKLPKTGVRMETQRGDNLSGMGYVDTSMAISGAHWTNAAQAYSAQRHYLRYMDALVKDAKKRGML